MVVQLVAAVELVPLAVTLHQLLQAQAVQDHQIQ
jgi:hypothetical protein